MMSVKEMVINNKQVKFIELVNEQLWYEAENEFQFPVDLSDTGSAAFIKQDKAFLFMRWIRKQFEKNEQPISRTNFVFDDGERAQFLRYQQKEVWYEFNRFEFPIPVTQNNGHFRINEQLKNVEKWIRIHSDNIELGKQSN